MSIEFKLVQDANILLKQLFARVVAFIIGLLFNLEQPLNIAE